MFNNGKYKLKDSEYHADRTRVSSTQLKKLISSTPRHFKHWLETPSEPSDSMLLGSAIHKYVLENDQFFDSFAVSQKFDRRTKEGKAGFAEFEMLNFGKSIITEEQFETVKSVKLSIDAHPLKENLFNNAEIETSFLWTDEDTNLLCKAKTDILKLSTLIDLKTTSSANAQKFSERSADLNYHVQLAFYADGIEKVTGVKITDHIIIAVETMAPYEVAVFRYSEPAIEQGRIEYKKALKLLAECKKTNQWPGYSLAIQDLFLPSWKTKKEETTTIKPDWSL